MISSTSNIKVKNIINLKKSAKARKKENCFLVEGPRMFLRFREIELWNAISQKNLLGNTIKN